MELKIITDLENHLTKYRGYIFYDANELIEYSKSRDLLLQEANEFMKISDSISETQILSGVKTQIEKLQCKLYIYCNKEYQASDILTEGDKKIMRKLYWDYMDCGDLCLFGVNGKRPLGDCDSLECMARAIYGERHGFQLGKSDERVCGKSLTEGVTWADYEFVMQKIYRHIVKICENI
jgi:hypothetical protein